MGSLLRTAKKHKKSRRLGEPEVMAREEYGELEVDVKIEMIRSLIPLGLMHVHELLDDEVKELAGERYARKDELERGRRHGTNPGTVGLAGQRVPIRVPRVRSQEGVEIPLRSYEALNDGGEVNDLLLKRVLYGISCRNYEAAAEAIPGVPSINSIPGRQDLLGPGLSSCQCFGQHHGDRGIEARPRTPRLVSHGHRVKRSELRQRDDCNNDGGRRPSEWLSRAPSKATAQVVARGHLSRAINESGRNDSSRRIRAGFA